MKTDGEKMNNKLNLHLLFKNFCLVHLKVKNLLTKARYVLY